jgi:Uma2 family endonuclease
LDRSDRTKTTAINPRVLIEVLSRTTEGYDRGDKFRRYLKIESLEEYVLVSQALPRIETFFRQPDGAWLFTHAVGLDASAKIRSLGIDVPLSETYAGVVFPQEPDPTEPQAF